MGEKKKKRTKLIQSKKMLVKQKDNKASVSRRIMHIRCVIYAKNLSQMNVSLTLTFTSISAPIAATAMFYMKW
jgi:hypothetical protein